MPCGFDKRLCGLLLGWLSIIYRNKYGLSNLLYNMMTSIFEISFK